MVQPLKIQLEAGASQYRVSSSCLNQAFSSSLSLFLRKSSLKLGQTRGEESHQISVSGLMAWMVFQALLKAFAMHVSFRGLRSENGKIRDFNVPSSYQKKGILSIANGPDDHLAVR